MARLAGRHADGFNSAWAWEPNDFRERIDLMNQAAEAAGRDPERIAKTVGLHTLAGASDRQVDEQWRRYLNCGSTAARIPPFDMWSRGKLVGTHRQVADRILRFSQLGVSEIILSFGSIPFRFAIPTMYSSSWKRWLHW